MYQEVICDLLTGEVTRSVEDEARTGRPVAVKTSKMIADKAG